MRNLEIRPKIVEIPVHRDLRGALAVIQSQVTSFRFKRVYFLFDVDAGSERGSHAHKSLKQFMIAVAGSFKVKLDDGVGFTKTYEMKNPAEALIIPSGDWRKIYDFSQGAVCLVLASEEYEENDYIRDYETFRAWKVSK